jgi:hypothetical protein
MDIEDAIVTLAIELGKTPCNQERDRCVKKIGLLALARFEENEEKSIELILQAVLIN